MCYRCAFCSGASTLPPWNIWQISLWNIWQNTNLTQIQLIRVTSGLWSLKGNIHKKLWNEGNCIKGFWAGQVWPDVAQPAVTERSGSSTKGRTPNIRYFVAKLSIVAFYALFERLSQSIERKPSCFRRALNESHPVFVELSTKDILILLS